MNTRTSENDMGLKKMMDMTRMISVAVLLLHFYYSCYAAFKIWGWTHPIGDRLLTNILHTGLFSNFHRAKLIALGFLSLSLLGTQGRKGTTFNYRTAFAYLLTGVLLYLISVLILYMRMQPTEVAFAYIVITSLGYILFMTGGSLLTRILKLKLQGDVFNKLNETFPQEERLLENKYSLNFRATYNLKGKTRPSWINVVNSFRGLLVMGNSGSGKTAFVVKEIIKQQIQKGFAMFIHDFKYPDLTNVAYYHFLQNKNKYKTTPEFYVINFDEPVHRCNPLMAQSIRSITDAASASRSILLGLNQDWIENQGDFWIESSINFVTALIWFLRKYKDGIYCTLPHVIELAQVEFEKLFTILRAEPTLEILVSPFIKAYQEDAGKQLIGQISGAAVSLGTLSTENLYYVLSGDDFMMTINDPKAPKIVCIANNPQVSNIYSAVISLYLNNLQKLLKEQEEQPCGIVLEEFANISWNGVDKFLSVCRSYLVSTTLVIQDASQLILHYGKHQADVIMSMAGNIISGQVTGDSARVLADRFGKIMQDRESVSINSRDTSVNHSKQMDFAIPQSTIASLSSGEFVGMVADTPGQRIEKKMFHSEFLIEIGSQAGQQIAPSDLPQLTVDNYVIMENYLRVKQESKNIAQNELERVMNTPELEIMIVKMNGKS
ncbi:YWFCY domain-containing protein [Pinibacter aurantiacus]|uniref:YWFCY domain-containing protein n=1 Tax=Pinibacter aurantiacus TaxID=2851599 RepID=A0A9E2SBJ8_9BACT|nr:YWFCY domain-containing protein [Pinibacter aurantiacus]MBV4359112.1 YWFCY domain-containing protein [Pinibacter aurantiacus]